MLNFITLLLQISLKNKLQGEYVFCKYSKSVLKSVFSEKISFSSVRIILTISINNGTFHTVRYTTAKNLRAFRQIDCAQSSM